MAATSFGSRYPSVTGPKRGESGLAVSSRTCSAVMARRAAIDAAPAPVANLTPSGSASERARGVMDPISDPLSMMAPAIRSFESGEATWALTEIEPADSPAIVTLFGSPPNAAMFACTQRRAAFWSRRP